MLDTCVVSELVKPKPKASVVDWVALQDESRLFMSVLTLGELEKGIAALPPSPRRKTLEQWVRMELAERFRGKLLAIDAAIAVRWGAMVGSAESRGTPLPVIDSLIAATSLHHELIVVTRNIEDLERCGAQCFNPWLAA